MDQLFSTILLSTTLCLCSMALSMKEPPSSTKKFVFSLSALFLSFLLPFFFTLMISALINILRES